MISANIKGGMNDAIFCIKENPTLDVGFRKAFSKVLKNAPLGVKINFGVEDFMWIQ